MSFGDSILYGLNVQEPSYGRFEHVQLYECLHLSTGDVIEDGPLQGTKDNIGSWIERQPPGTCVGGIRLILVHSDTVPPAVAPTVPFVDHAELTSAMQKLHLATCIAPFLGLFKLNPLHDVGVSYLIPTCSDQASDGRKAWVMRKSFPTRTYLMSSYQSQTNTVSVFAIFNDRAVMSRLLEAVRRHKNYTCHPMLIPSLITSDYFFDLMEIRSNLAREVGTLESKAGVRAFSEESNSDFIVNTQVVVRTSVDLKARLQDIIVLIRALDICTLKPLLEGIDIVRQDALQSPPDHPVRILSLQRGMELQDRIVAMKQERFVSLEFMEVLVAKTNTTLSALYNMFTLRDNKLNIEMARDSRDMARSSHRNAELNLQVAEYSLVIANAAKRDSSSMKSIAVLTTLFLPGTYVATLLAMPTVDWTPPNIWRYWVITVPLTLLVMATWAIYMFVINKTQKRTLNEAQEQMVANLEKE